MIGDAFGDRAYKHSKAIKAFAQIRRPAGNPNLATRGNGIIALDRFRAASVNERRRRTFGFSWTSDLGIALGFIGHLHCGTSLLLETVAPPEAILCYVDASLPYNHAAVGQLKEQYPDLPTT